MRQAHARCQQNPLEAGQSADIVSEEGNDKEMESKEGELRVRIRNDEWDGETKDRPSRIKGQRVNDQP